ncbi:precorrin-6A synthase (deacetylating) [Corynebacterium freiburgense]|uniref:precorrin-6A synthase (deacetylating) n=1 Tax=Corynebacterium freiburgense TaxID=556548 RepID=UPI0003F53376|nr:precorrin-6A synthase (deacetylating) [Corynebacterium freiburgense]WJZ02043.1 precorrin 6A synthase [Corynebacterium freiburgense]
MRRLFVIGIGAGSPQHVTLEAVDALRDVGVVLAFDKGESKDALLALRREILANHAPDIPLVLMPDPPRDRNPEQYIGEVRRWLDERAALLEHALIEHTEEGEAAAILVWGDPSLYDSTLRIIGQLGIEVETRVIPGITAIQALTAAHGITLNTIGGEIIITTARRFSIREDQNNCVVMLDGGAGWLASKDPDAELWWGAYLGMEHQVIRHGRIAEIGHELAELKEELRKQYGWIMDIYLVRSSAA